MNGTSPYMTDSDGNTIRTMSGVGSVARDTGNKLSNFDASVSFDGTDDYFNLNQSLVIDLDSAFCMQYCAEVDSGPGDIYGGTIMGSSSNANTMLQWHRIDLGTTFTRADDGTPEWNSGVGILEDLFTCWTITKSASSGLYMYQNDTFFSYKTATSSGDILTLDRIGGANNANADFSGNMQVITLWNKNCTQQDATDFYDGGAGECVDYTPPVTPPNVTISSPQLTTVGTSFSYLPAWLNTTTLTFGSNISSLNGGGTTESDGTIKGYTNFLDIGTTNITIWGDDGIGNNVTSWFDLITSEAGSGTCIENHGTWWFRPNNCGDP